MPKPAPSPAATPAELIAALRGGIDAYERLIHLYHPALLQAAREDISPELEALFGASGVVQETFWKVWQAFRDFRGHTEAEFVSWLQQILQSVLRDQERKLQAQKRAVGREERFPANGSSYQPLEPWPDPRPSPGSQAALREQVDQLRRALDRLPLEQRLALLLQKECELPDEQIGRLLSCSPQAVRMKRVRALARIRLEMGGKDDA